MSACTSQIIGTNESIKGAIGVNISAVQELYLTPANRSISFLESKVHAWNETQQAFENGDIQHSFSNPYRDCTIILIADEAGIIKSGSYFGAQCSR